MQNTQTLARICGGIYLVLIITGIFSLVYMPAVLFDWDNPAATIANIGNREMFFRVGILCGIVCFTCYVALPLCLYFLLEQSGRKLAIWMLAFSIPSVPITFSSYVKLLDVLSLIKEERYAQLLPTTNLQAEVMFLLQSHNNGSLIAEAFWGLWLLPLGYLLFKSRALPRLLGICLILGGVGYLIDLVGKLVFNLESLPTFISVPGTVGEFGTCMWLLILGARITPQPQAAVAEAQ